MLITQGGRCGSAAPSSKLAMFAHFLTAMHHSTACYHCLCCTLSRTLPRLLQSCAALLVLVQPSGRPFGMLAAAFLAARIFFDSAAALYPSGSEMRARNYTRPMTRPGELAEAWRAGGLIGVRDTMLTIRMDFASFDDYWAPYEGKDGPGAQYITTLNTVQKERLRDVVRAAYLDGERDGPRSYAATAWAVKGTVPA